MELWNWNSDYMDYGSMCAFLKKMNKLAKRIELRDLRGRTNENLERFSRRFG